MRISTQKNIYFAKILNISQNIDISDFVDSIDIVMPNTNEISSMVAKFTLEQKLIDTGNEIKIDVLDDTGNTIYSLNGEAKLLTETLNYTNLHNYSYEVKDSYSKLFEKNIAETQVFYDLYLCNNADVNNSLMHIIAKNLGFKNLDFHNALYENGQYIRVPFVIFRENEKWIDELQSLIAATNSVLYITSGKLFFKVNNFTLNNNVIFDKTNIITRISKSYKATENNGVKILYDRYKKLENQVVFNLKSKITVEKNTNKDTEVKSMRISYITSSVAEPSITKATGYYFRTHGDVNSKVDVDLIRDTHYVLEEFTETQAIVKFYNPFNYDLIIDNFEIKGIPLVMYTDNSAIVKNKIVVEKNQENFSVVNKNKYIQTPELAINIAKQIYRSNISSQFSYNLDTIFINNLQLGDVYNLAFENIDVIGRLISYTIQLRPSDFRLSLKLDEIGTLDNVALSYTDSLNSNSQYIDLSSIEKELAENKQELRSIKSSFESLEQSIQDNKTKIYTLKPAISTLTDSNIGDIYISDSSAEILVKENNNFVWKPITDSSVRTDLNEYIKSNNAKVIDITYQNTEPENPKNGDIWIDTGNDGIWKRYTNNAWMQIDESVRTAIATANTNISEIEKKIKTINSTIDNKILAKAFVQEEQPTSGMKNHDIWYKPSNNSFKKWLNNRWNTATEDDIFPALRHYVSLATAQLDIGKRIDGVNEKAGMFLTNNNTKFGAKNGTLAEVSLSKTGEILIKNANNLIQWNVKDPTSNKMKSRFLMGVQDVDAVPAETYFKIGDEATGFSLELKEGSSVAKINGENLGEKLSNVDRNINNLSQNVSDSLNTAKSYTDTKKAEIDRQLTNADGRLTQLQQNYQNTIQDVTNFKTRTADRIDTVQGALDNGNFVVNGNTTFADGVRFVSRGTNEVITIANGAITFNRDGQKLTRIKNSRYGTIATDSAGKGVVNFTGFKQPMIVLTSIKSANFGKNMASVFCYAEHITGTQYRMFVGGTNEHYTEARPIKVVGTEWSTLNAFKTTLLEMTGNFKESGGNYTLQNLSSSYEQYKDFSKRTDKVLKVPKFNVKIVRVDGTAETVLHTQDYTVSYYFKGRHDHDGWRGYRESYYKIEPINLTKTFNLLKTYTARTNVKFKLVITILEPNFTIERYFAYSHTSYSSDNESTHYDSAKYVGTLRTITPADFTGLSITASSETSTLSGVTGTGEVQYIAMEID